MAALPKSLPTGSAAVPVSPPTTGASSYRPMGGPGKGTHLLVTAVVVLLIALAGAGTVLWVQGRHSVEPTTVAALPGPASPPPGTATELVPSPSPAMAPAAGEPQPTSVPPPAQTRPSPRPQLPPPLETRPTPTPAPATQEQEPTPTEPAPRQEPEEPSAGTAGDPEMLPLVEMRQTAGELKTESTRLYALYEAFLEAKEDGGAELTSDDEQLLEELENFEEAAAGFNKQLKERGFLGRARGRRPGDRMEMMNRVRTLAERGQRVDALMARVQPGGDVEEAWQGIRRRWQRARALAGGAGGG